LRRRRKRGARSDFAARSLRRSRRNRVGQAIEAVCVAPSPPPSRTMRVVNRLYPLLSLVLLAAACGGLPWGGSPGVTWTRNDEAAGVRFIETVTGGASASDTLPLVVAIHGFSGKPNDFLTLATLSSLTARARVVAPYGLAPAGDGFAWFDGSDGRQLPENMRRAADSLAAMIDALVKSRPTAGKPIVTGFSQGGMMSYALAVLHPDLVRAAFPASGYLPPPLCPSAWPAGKEMPRLHAFHGAADGAIPIARDRATVQQLAALGLHVELTVYPGEGHVVSTRMKRDLRQALAQELGP
jgi:phospholipase/carboxylesterase